MYVVENRPLYTCFTQKAWQTRLPYPFRNPGARGLRSEVALCALCEPVNLRDFIAIRNRGKDRFIITAADHFDLIALDELCNALDELRVRFFQPIQERACIVQGKAYFGVSFQCLDER